MLIDVWINKDFNELCIKVCVAFSIDHSWKIDFPGKNDRGIHTCSCCSSAVMLFILTTLF